MAPVCADPRQIVITFEPARRRALLKLVDDITRHMLAQLEDTSNELGPVEPEPDKEDDQKQQKTQQSSSSSSSASPPSRGDESSTGGSTPRLQQQGSDSRPQDAKSSGFSVKNPFESSKKPERIQQAAIKHMKEWRKEFMSKLEEIALVEDDDKIRNERKKRLDAMESAHKSGETSADGEEDLIDLGGGTIDKSEDFFSLQLLYEPLPTSLTSVREQDRKEALSSILLLLLSTGKYSAHSRTLILYIASSLELPQSFVIREETEIAKSLMESSTGEKDKEQAMNAEAEAEKRQKENKFSRYWKVGLASVAGATIIGVTGGLAAPLVAGALGGVLGGIGLGGVASFLGIFWMNGALVGALFGAFGAKMTGSMMDKYAKEISDFKFIPLHEPSSSESDQQIGTESDAEEAAKKQQQDRRLRVTIGINGWLNSEDDVTNPWRVLSTETEAFALRYEMKTLLTLGTAFQDLAKSAAINVLKSEIIKRTALATLWAALWPIQVLSAASNVDNPFNHASNRSKKAGQLLADALINKVQGERPVTLIGFSNGATAIHACLQSLADRRAFGLIDTVVIIGTPAPAAPGHWRTLRSVVSGKIFNVFSENDMILSFVYRMHTLSLGVAGLQPIKDVSNLENLDLSQVVSGHLRYPGLTGEILRKCGFVGIDASKEIEEDDLIKMKRDYAEGKITDAELEQKQAEQGISSDMDNLHISQGDEDEKSPALPQRPSATAGDTKNPPLPRRPAQSSGQSQSQSQSQSIPRRPVGSAKPVSEASRTSEAAPADPKDAGGDHHGGIIMTNNDSD